MSTDTPAQWRKVPVEPTQEMCAAAVRFANGSAVYKNVAAEVLKIEESIYAEVYEAMLAASPQPTAAQPLTDEQIDAIALHTVYDGDDTCAYRGAWCREVGRPFARAIERARGIGASAAPMQAAQEPIHVEAVAEVVKRDDELDLSWLIEGGICALPEGVVLLVSSKPITDNEGSGEVYLAAPTQAVANTAPNLACKSVQKRLATQWGYVLGEQAAPTQEPTPKADRVHVLVNAGPYPGMSEAFDAHMGAACWSDPAYRQDAATWAAAWKATLRQSAAPTQPAQAAAPIAAELVEALRKAEGVLEEAQTYTSSPSWSPSMTEECAAALATVRAALSRAPGASNV